MDTQGMPMGNAADLTGALSDPGYLPGHGAGGAFDAGLDQQRFSDASTYGVIRGYQYRNSANGEQGAASPDEAKANGVEYKPGMTQSQLDMTVQAKKDDFQRDFTAAKYQDNYPVTSLLGSLYGGVSDPGASLLTVATFGSADLALGVGAAGRALEAGPAVARLGVVGVTGGAAFSAAQIPATKYASVVDQQEYGQKEMLHDLGMNMAMGLAGELVAGGIGRILSGPKERLPSQEFSLNPQLDPHNPEHTTVAANIFDSAQQAILQGKVPNLEDASAYTLMGAKNDTVNALEFLKESKANYEAGLNPKQLDAVRGYETADVLERHAQETEYGFKQENLPEGLSFEEAHSGLQAIEDGRRASAALEKEPEGLLKDDLTARAARGDQAQAFLDHFGFDTESRIAYRDSYGAEQAQSTRDMMKQIKDTASASGPDLTKALREKISGLQEKVNRFPADQRLVDSSNRHLDLVLNREKPPEPILPNHVVHEELAKAENPDARMQQEMADHPLGQEFRDTVAAENARYENRAKDLETVSKCLSGLGD